MAVRNIVRSRRYNFDKLYPWQEDPVGAWYYRIVYGGRGIGKTACGSKWVVDKLREYGDKTIIGIGGRTRDDVRTRCAEGHSGIMQLWKSEFVKYNKSTLEAWHSDGGYIRFMGMDESGSWNGPNWTHLWIDEFGLVNLESWRDALIGLRLPPRPQCLLTFTPKKQKPANLKEIKRLLKKENAVVQHGKTKDAIFLDPTARAELIETYDGTRIGRQELDGEILDDIEGALWNQEWIDDNRAVLNDDGSVTRLKDKRKVSIVRKVVAVDPAGGSKSENAETGEAVAGLGDDGDYYLFESSGRRVSPAQWGEHAILSYYRHKADLIIGESNFGGDMVVSTIQRFDRNVKVEKRTASRGKAIRAEPIAGLYEKGRVHHIGIFDELEVQMTAMTEHGEMQTEEGIKDRLDAAVWALTEVSGGDGGGVIIGRV